ncbi:GAF and ANTAR domain-containing protein [Streptomyces sp. Ru73]|uniref:GAF and ANTAR domain-containing protein n=1 Tax=Streptomyces sp. Ru73 TaxID=2080748 RepID=UPI0015E42C77|nr:GAF and ANTAR domain-containing protein [Streptomyces sp. Ru73]
MREPSAAAELVLAAAAGADSRELPELLCAALCRALPVDGVTISLLTDTPDRQLLHASGTAALRLEQVQFKMGEGPCVSAAATGEPVIVADLHGRLTQWPLFGPAAREELPDIGSVYAFPMTDGSGEHPVGSVDLLRREAWDPDEETLQECVEATRAATVVLLTAPTALPWEPTPLMDAHWGRTHRAAGVLSQRTGVSVDEALARLRADAFGSGRSLPDVAEETLSRLLGDSAAGGHGPPDAQ